MNSRKTVRGPRRRDLVPGLFGAADTRPFALFAVLLAWATLLPGGELALRLDPARTAVRFTLPATLHTVRGAFQLKRGDIRFDPATGAIAGEIVVDAASGNSGDDARDRRMLRDILESGRYPEIVFTPDRVEGALAWPGDSLVQVHGMFRIHGAAHEITVTVEVKMEGGRTTATARFPIPYVQWGMKNPSTLFLRAGERVEIEVAAAALP